MGPSLFNNLSVYLFVAIFLLGAGILGVVHRRTLIGMLVSVELILNGAGPHRLAFRKGAVVRSTPVVLPDMPILATLSYLLFLP